METRLQQPPYEINSLEMSHRAKTFFWAASFLPLPIRYDLERLYKFCRYVDDTVDCCNNKELARRSIEQIITDLENKNSDIKQVQDFLDLAIKRNLPLNCAIELTSGIASDIYQAQIRSHDELIRYCYRVASTVGIMICYLFNVTSPEALAFGVDLGIAMQLTNIARDIFEDFGAERIYLPANLINKEKIQEAISGDLNAREQVLIAAKNLIDLADIYYASAENGMCYLPNSIRLGVMVASAAYREIGQTILRQPKIFFHRRVSTTWQQKQLCLIKALFALMTDKKYWAVNYSKNHQPNLHIVLRGLSSFDLG